MAKRLGTSGLISLSEIIVENRDNMTQYWDVDRVLNRFISDPTAFRSQMAKYNILVAGSLALQFFERVCWPESDMDVFLEEKDINLDEFGNYLEKEEQYALMLSTLPQRVSEMHELSQV